jgi:hypothetical protein
MPATNFRFPQARSGADDWFHYPDVTPLAGRVAPAAELDEAAADLLANAIAAFSGRRRAAAARLAAAPAPAPEPPLPDRVPGRLGGGAEPSRAPSPIRTPGGWRNG